MHLIFLALMYTVVNNFLMILKTLIRMLTFDIQKGVYIWTILLKILLI